MKLRNILMLVLALCMVFALCACGNTGDADSTTTEATNETTEATTEETVDDGKVTYTVTVVDEGGNPVSGVMVQLCLESCTPGLTDAEGVATYDLAEADYHVSFVSIPEGYAEDATEYYFEDGSYEMTLTLKAVA